MPIICKRLQTAGDIPDLAWSGYLRMSNAQTNTIIDGTLDADLLSATDNPFVLAAHLVARDDSHSLAITHTGDAQIITLVQWGDSPASPEPGDILGGEDILAPGIGFDEPRMLRFQQLWQAEADPCCAGMTVLRPALLAFRGFSIQEPEVAP